jgi:hypothetical protein
MLHAPTFGDTSRVLSGKESSKDMLRKNNKNKSQPLIESKAVLRWKQAVAKITLLRSSDPNYFDEFNDGNLVSS